MKQADRLILEGKAMRMKEKRQRGKDPSKVQEITSQDKELEHLFQDVKAV